MTQNDAMQHVLDSGAIDTLLKVVHVLTKGHEENANEEDTVDVFQEALSKVLELTSSLLSRAAMLPAGNRNVEETQAAIEFLNYSATVESACRVLVTSVCNLDPVLKSYLAQEEAKANTRPNQSESG